MNEKLDQEMIKQQKTIIMNRIQSYETKQVRNRKYKPMILVAAVLLIFMMPIFLNSSSSFGITQISANEYTLHLFGDKVHFTLYALVENPNKIPINDDMAYYEGFQKYFDVTSKFKLEPIDIDGYLFLKMMQGKEVISYLYVDNYDEHTRSVNRIEREFSDFESEMREIIDNVKAYPYEMMIESDGWCAVEANKEAHELSDEALEDYLWFKDMQLRLWAADPIDSYEAVLYLDEAGQIINSGHVIGQYGEEFPVDFNVKPSSTLSGNDEVNGLKISSYKYLFEEMEEMQWLSAMKIDFGTLNPDDYEVQVKVNEEIVPLQWWTKDENTLYMASDFIPLNLEFIEIKGQDEVDFTVSMRVELSIMDKVTGEILVDYGDYHSMLPSIHKER